jgi:hypothetical protein
VEPAARAADAALDLLALGEAPGELERAEPREAALVKLRFFAGLTGGQAAATLGVSPATAQQRRGRGPRHGPADEVRSELGLCFRSGNAENRPENATGSAGIRTLNQGIMSPLL